MYLIKLYGPQAKFKFVIVDQDDFEIYCKYRWAITKIGENYQYAHSFINGKQVYLHRIIMGNPLGMDVHHKNHDTLDCRKQNLEIMTHKKNSQLRIKPRIKNASSQYKGVKKHKNKWVARITVDYKEKHIGVFNTEEDAAKAYDYYALQKFGKSAIINFPEFDYSQYVIMSNKRTSVYTQYKYVSKERNKFSSQVYYGGKTHRIGNFNTDIEAAKAADQYIKDNNLEKPLNFPIESKNKL